MLIAPLLPPLGVLPPPLPLGLMVPLPLLPTELPPPPVPVDPPPEQPVLYAAKQRTKGATMPNAFMHFTVIPPMSPLSERTGRYAHRRRNANA
jgi:hypothetical protein